MLTSNPIFSSSGLKFSRRCSFFPDLACRSGLGSAVGWSLAGYPCPIGYESNDRLCYITYDAATTRRTNRHVRLIILHDDSRCHWRASCPGSSRFAIGLPSLWVLNEKSVSSLFGRKPLTIKREPNAFSMVVVIDTTLPSLSTILKWLVDGSSIDTSWLRSIAWSWRGAWRHLSSATCGN